MSSFLHVQKSSMEGWFLLKTNALKKKEKMPDTKRVSPAILFRCELMDGNSRLRFHLLSSRQAHLEPALPGHQAVAPYRCRNSHHGNCKGLESLAPLTSPVMKTRIESKRYESYWLLFWESLTCCLLKIKAIEVFSFNVIIDLTDQVWTNLRLLRCNLNVITDKPCIHPR